MSATPETWPYQDIADWRSNCTWTNPSATLIRKRLPGCCLRSYCSPFERTELREQFFGQRKHVDPELVRDAHPFHTFESLTFGSDLWRRFRGQAIGDEARQPEQRHCRGGGAGTWPPTQRPRPSFRNALKFAFNPSPATALWSLRMTVGFGAARFDDILTTVLDALFSYAA